MQKGRRLCGRLPLSAYAIIFYLFQPVFDLLVSTSAIQLVLLKQLYCRAGLAEYVVYADLLYRSRKLLTKYIANCAAKAADDRMLFCSYYLASLLCGLQDDLLVQRLDGVDIDYLCGNTLCRQLLSRFQSAVYTKSCSYDSKVCTLS